MAICDLTIATGGPAMVKAAYSSGKPAYGVGAGNATMVIDETADIEEAARNTRISKTNDNGSGCSADGNLLVDARDLRRASSTQLQQEGGYLVDDAEKALLAGGLLGRRGPPHRRHHRARRQRSSPRRPASRFPTDKTFFIVRRTAHRQGSTASRPRSSASCSRSSSTTASTRRSTWCGRSSRPAARATRAASTRSTTTTSIGSRWSRR